MNRTAQPAAPTTLRADQVEVGAAVPELVIEATPTFVVSTAIGTRDFQDVHHDRDAAVRRGSKDIFVNILTSTGLAQRFVTDWAGPEALVRAVSIRLGAPCYAGDTLRFTGRVTERVTEGGEERLRVAVTGACGLGDHVSGTVTIALPAPGDASGRQDPARHGGGREDHQGAGASTGRGAADDSAEVTG